MTDAVTSTFADRHVGPDQEALRRILDVVGVGSLADLAEKALPAGILDPETGGTADGLEVLDAPLSEHEVLAALTALAAQNTVRRR